MLDKKLISIRYWLIGRQYHLALRALEFASHIHVGKRKNGDPEFGHQTSIAHYMKTLIHEIELPEETLATIFLHDTPEDYDIGFEEIEMRFGKVVRISTELLTKKFRGTKMPTDSYFNGIAANNIASLVKGADRINNIQTITDVFTVEKQQEYIFETEKYILPMLKVARRTFTKQEPAYENIKLVLKSQIELIKAIKLAKE